MTRTGWLLSGAAIAIFAGAAGALPAQAYDDQDEAVRMLNLNSLQNAQATRMRGQAEAAARFGFGGFYGGYMPPPLPAAPLAPMAPLAGQAPVIPLGPVAGGQPVMMDTITPVVPVYEPPQLSVTAPSIAAPVPVPMTVDLAPTMLDIAPPTYVATPQGPMIAPPIARTAVPIPRRGVIEPVPLTYSLTHHDRARGRQRVETNRSAIEARVITEPQIASPAEPIPRDELPAAGDTIRATRGARPANVIAPRLTAPGGVSLNDVSRPAQVLSHASVETSQGRKLGEVAQVELDARGRAVAVVLSGNRRIPTTDLIFVPERRVIVQMSR